MSASAMSPIEPGAVADIEPLHRPAEVGLAQFDQQMIMVGHQNIGVESDVKPLDKFAEQLQEMNAVPMVRENGTPFVAPRGQMIPAGGIHKSQRAGHAWKVKGNLRDLSIVKCGKLTPLTLTPLTLETLIVLGHRLPNPQAQLGEAEKVLVSVQNETE